MLKHMDQPPACSQVKAAEAPEAVAGGEAGTVCWVCGEAASVEVEIRNPTIIPIKVLPRSPPILH